MKDICELLYIIKIMVNYDDLTGSKVEEKLATTAIKLVGQFNFIKQECR